MSTGWLQFPKTAFESPAFSKGNECHWRLYCWCLRQAEWKDTRKDGRIVRRGTFFTTRSEMASWLGELPSTCYKRLNKLAEWGLITISSSNLETLVTITHYPSYDSGQDPPVAGEWQAGGRPVAGQCQASVNEGVPSLVKNEEVKTLRTPKPPAGDVEFENFWDVFPSRRKAGKKDARRAWDKAIRSGARPAEIISAAEAYAASPRGNCEYTKGPAPWLNQGCWEDDRAAWQHGDDVQPARNGQSPGLFDTLGVAYLDALEEERREEIRND